MLQQYLALVPQHLILTGQMTVMCERMSRVHQATLHNVVLETQEYATQV